MIIYCAFWIIIFFVSKRHFILQKMPRKIKKSTDRKKKEQKTRMKKRRNHGKAKSNLYKLSWRKIYLYKLSCREQHLYILSKKATPL